MTYTLSELLGIKHRSADPISLRVCLERYFELSDKYITELVNDLTSFNAQQKLYIFPDNNMDLGSQIKKLIVAGLLILYEWSKSPIVLVQVDQLLKNEKLCTPDVLFYLITMMNSLLKQRNITEFDVILDKITKEMNSIGLLDSKYFDVNLFNVKMLNISERTLQQDCLTDPNEVLRSIIESFSQSLAEAEQKETVHLVKNDEQNVEPAVVTPEPSPKEETPSNGGLEEYLKNLE